MPVERPAEPSPLPRPLTAPELIAADLPERRTILDPILSTKSLALLYGPRGSGKTFLALGIAWAAASGGRFLDWQAARPRRVVYVDGEMAAVDMRERLRLFGAMPEITLSQQEMLIQKHYAMAEQMVREP